MSELKQNNDPSHKIIPLVHFTAVPCGNKKFSNETIFLPLFCISLFLFSFPQFPVGEQRGSAWRWLPHLPVGGEGADETLQGPRLFPSGVLEDGGRHGVKETGPVGGDKRKMATPSLSGWGLRTGDETCEVPAADGSSVSPPLCRARSQPAVGRTAVRARRSYLQRHPSCYRWSARVLWAHDAPLSSLHELRLHIHRADSQSPFRCQRSTSCLPLDHNLVHNNLFLSTYPSDKEPIEKRKKKNMISDRCKAVHKKKTSQHRCHKLEKMFPSYLDLHQVWMFRMFPQSPHITFGKK